METADEIVEDKAVEQSDTISDGRLTGDQSKSGLLSHKISSDHHVQVHMNNVSLKKSDATHPSLSKNGIAVHKEIPQQVQIDAEANSKRIEASNLSHITSIDLTVTQIQEQNQKRDGLEIDYVDSGVHSGAENGSDEKSSSSSPILSTESSVHDLCEKTEKICALDGSTNENKLLESRSHVDKLTSDVSNTLLLPTIDAASDVIPNDVEEGIEYVVYESELQMPDIMKLITKDLSEPYSIYTYRYFIHNWPKLCFLAMDKGLCVGAIVCKLDMHKKMVRRGYIAMLAVDQSCRRKGIGSHLVLKAIGAMIADDCDEVVLETEITNKAALRLYENLGFVRDKRLFRYYLNGVDALRLKLWLR